jgi:hypothetical protein
MARPKKPDAKNWRERKFPEDWNVTTFRAYLSEMHEKKLGVKYVTPNIKMECGMIKNMKNEYGPEVLREFIDRALAQYRPTQKYPGISFPVMVRFYKARLIPRILKELSLQKEREQQQQQIEVEAVEMDDVLDLL